jgi:serine/threonine-protein kinase
VQYDVGETLDRRYRLKRLIARSERGVVFEAEHLHLSRAAAVRLLAAEEAGDEAAAERLLLEARRLDEARHPAVVRVLDAARTPQGEPFVATEVLAGRTLDGVLAVEERLPVEDAVAIARSVAEALARAHAAGVFHAGLAPTSILRAAPSAGGPAAKLLDVGVAPSPIGVLGGPLAAMAYAAPERLGGGAPDAAADVHALGAILFEMLRGELPPREASPELPPDVPRPLAAVVRRALAERAERYATMDALAAALREATRVEPPAPSLPPPPRAFPRAPYVTPVRLRRPNGDALDGRSEDISEGGLLVLVSGEVTAEESVLVRFALPSSGRLVSVPATTRWVRRAGGREALGLRFEDPGQKVLDDIRAYVDYLASPG